LDTKRIGKKMKNKIELTPRQLKPEMVVKIKENFYIVGNTNRIGNTSYVSSMINEDGKTVKEFLLINEKVELVKESYKDSNRMDKQEKYDRDHIVMTLGTDCGFQKSPDKVKKKLAELIMNVKDLYTKDEEPDQEEL